MRREPFSHHIESIFQALDVGLDGMTENCNFKSVTNDSMNPDDIDPDKFNRMKINIDGEEYTVSVFRSSQPPSPECPKSTHGEHTPVDGKCIGCGEQVT